MNDDIKVIGTVQVQLFREDGTLKEERAGNLVVSAGKTYIASRMVGTASAVMGWMAVGTSSTAPAAGDTTLGAEVGGSRTALGSATSSSNVATFSCTFGPGVGTGSLQEAGIFNASSAGTMLAHVTFSVVNKAAGDTMTITWTVTVN